MEENCGTRPDQSKQKPAVTLISKKELLQQTGISYGQLYRWKREKLIPESWFIKQASYTGQETFFPREQILPRIQSILENKDKYSLSELSRMLSPDTAPALICGTALSEITEIASDLLPAILYFDQKESYDLFDLALFASISRAAETLHADADDRRRITERAITASTLRQLDSVLTVFTAGGEFHAVISKVDSPLVFDSTIRNACSVSVSEMAASIKMKYRALFPAL